ncbi:hypothetical protein N9R79_07810, partial [Vibrio sp.]|nr:hypothetical protein [Vibrio sp.]
FGAGIDPEFGQELPVDPGMGVDRPIDPNFGQELPGRPGNELPSYPVTDPDFGRPVPGNELPNTDIDPDFGAGIDPEFGQELPTVPTQSAFVLSGNYIAGVQVSDCIGNTLGTTDENGHVAYSSESKAETLCTDINGVAMSSSSSVVSPFTTLVDRLMAEGQTENNAEAKVEKNLIAVEKGEVLNNQIDAGITPIATFGDYLRLTGAHSEMARAAQQAEVILSSSDIENASTQLLALRVASEGIAKNDSFTAYSLTVLERSELPSTFTHTAEPVEASDIKEVAEFDTTEGNSTLAIAKDSTRFITTQTNEANCDIDSGVQRIISSADYESIAKYCVDSTTYAGSVHTTVEMTPAQGFGTTGTTTITESSFDTNTNIIEIYTPSYDETLKSTHTTAIDFGTEGLKTTHTTSVYADNETAQVLVTRTEHGQYITETTDHFAKGTAARTINTFAFEEKQSNQGIKFNTLSSVNELTVGEAGKIVLKVTFPEGSVNPRIVPTMNGNTIVKEVSAIESHEDGRTVIEYTFDITTVADYKAEVEFNAIQDAEFAADLFAEGELIASRSFAINAVEGGNVDPAQPIINIDNLIGENESTVSVNADNGAVTFTTKDDYATAYFVEVDGDKLFRGYTLDQSINTNGFENAFINVYLIKDGSKIRLDYQLGGKYAGMYHYDNSFYTQEEAKSMFGDFTVRQYVDSGYLVSEKEMIAGNFIFRTNDTTENASRTFTIEKFDVTYEEVIVEPSEPVINLDNLLGEAISTVNNNGSVTFTTKSNKATAYFVKVDGDKLFRGYTLEQSIDTNGFEDAFINVYLIKGDEKIRLDYNLGGKNAGMYRHENELYTPEEAKAMFGDYTVRQYVDSAYLVSEQQVITGNFIFRTNGTTDNAVRDFTINQFDVTYEDVVVEPSEPVVDVDNIKGAKDLTTNEDGSVSGNVIGSSATVFTEVSGIELLSTYTNVEIAVDNKTAGYWNVYVQSNNGDEFRLNYEPSLNGFSVYKRDFDAETLVSGAKWVDASDYTMSTWEDVLTSQYADMTVINWQEGTTVGNFMLRLKKVDGENPDFTITKYTVK